MSLAEMVSEGRKAKGWNQTELAKAVGIKQVYVSEIENGKGPSISVASKIAEALGLNRAEAVRMARALKSGSQRITSDERQLIQAIRRGDRRQANDLFNGLLP